jgi:hypothetical protein
MHVSIIIVKEAGQSQPVDDMVLSSIADKKHLLSGSDIAEAEKEKRIADGIQDSKQQR